MHQCLSEGGTIPGLALPGTKQTNVHHEIRLTVLATPALLKVFLTRINSLNVAADRLNLLLRFYPLQDVSLLC